MISEVIQEQYLCSICELPFLSRKLVNRHSLSAHKKKIYIVQHYCTRCPNYYQSKEDLNHHFQIAHVEKCTKCPQSFQSKGELNYHYEQTHTVPCSKCPKRFSSFSTASSETRSPLREKEFSGPTLCLLSSFMLCVHQNKRGTE